MFQTVYTYVSGFLYMVFTWIQAANPAWIQAIMTILIFTVACLAYRQTHATRELNLRNLRRSGLRDVVYNDYTRREVKERDEIEIPNPDGTVEKITRLAVARKKAFDLLLQDYDSWKIASDFNKPENWQNHIAYEISVALQQLGFSAFTGSVSLKELLADVPQKIIEDWIICEPWILSIREKSGRKKLSTKIEDYEVYHHRRHAEWLFYITVAAQRHQEWLLSKKIEKVYGVFPDKEELKRRIIAINNADIHIQPSDVRKEASKLIGFKI